MSRLNDIFLYLHNNKITIKSASERTGINYFRLRRLTHEPDLYSALTVKEMDMIIRAYPDFYAQTYKN